jgi:hypothetical protein
VPGRDISIPTTRGAGRSRRPIVWVAVALALAIGILIGSRIASRGEPAPRVVEQPAAPPTGARHEPGRRAPTPAAHTRAGAVVAAARSITAFAGNVLLEPSRLRSLVGQIASSGSRTQLIEAFEGASAQTRAKLGAGTVPRPVILLRAVPLGYRVEHYSTDEARIAVWYVGIVGSGATVQPQQSWRTQTVNLVWERGGWKVSRFASSPGPTPALSTAGAAEPPGELFAAIPRFQEFGYGAR